MATGLGGAFVKIAWNRWPSRIGVVGAVVAIASLSAVWIGSANGTTTAPASDLTSAESALVNAANLHQSLGAVPQYKGVKSAVDTNSLKAAGTRDSGEIPKKFSPELQSKEKAALTASTDAQARGNFHHLGGGVSNVAYTKASTAVDGSVQLDGTWTVWSSVEGLGQDGKWYPATPTEQAAFHATLRQDPAGTWLVTSLVQQVVPGTGP